MSFCDPPFTPPYPVLTATAQYLLDAQTAYHALMTGTRVVRVKDQNGEEIQYDQMNASRLLAYIQSLQRALGLITCEGPMRITF